MQWHLSQDGLSARPKAKYPGYRKEPGQGVLLLSQVQSDLLDICNEDLFRCQVR